MTRYKLRSQYDKKQIEKEDNGNFIVQKEYIVSEIPKISGYPQIEGIIVQYVNKTTEVTDALGNKYNTTAGIEALTSGIVKYSNDSYFEIFEVYKNGRSINADAFQNGSIVQYDTSLEPHTYDVTDPSYQTYKTKGRINVVGENCFISSKNPKYSEINNLKWSTSIDTPANGLPYLPYSKKDYKLIFDSSDSNILIHTVNVKWTFANPKSIVKSIVTSEVSYKNKKSSSGIIYGGNIYIRKSKNKKHTHKHKRRSKSRKI
jgi:hypothetical protein